MIFDYILINLDIFNTCHVKVYVSIMSKVKYFSPLEYM